jgi:hypothetical protein
MRDSGFLWDWPDLSQPFQLLRQVRVSGFGRNNKIRSIRVQLSVFTGGCQGILEVSASGSGEGGSRCCLGVSAGQRLPLRKENDGPDLPAASLIPAAHPARPVFALSATTIRRGSM